MEENAILGLLGQRKMIQSILAFCWRHVGSGGPTPGGLLQQDRLPGEAEPRPQERVSEMV